MDRSNTFMYGTILCNAQVLATQWQRLQRSILAATDFEMILAAHQVYMSALLQQCFLDDTDVINLIPSFVHIFLVDQQYHV